MPGAETRPTSAGDADAIAAHRPHNTDAFARQEPHRPDMPVTLSAAGSLADRTSRVAAIARPRKTPACATSVMLLGPLFHLLASTGLLRWFVNRERPVHSFGSYRGTSPPRSALAWCARCSRREEPCGRPGVTVAFRARYRRR